MACAKHFPGHGDTDQDSHHTLPSIPHDVSRLDSIELYPFKEMIKHGISGIMIAHLALPALDGTPINGVIAPDSPTMPATLSQAIVSKLLIEEMNYTGLIFTDALNMKGVAKYYEPGIVDVKALLAGNDILLFPENVGKAVQEIEKAVKEGLITPHTKFKAEVYVLKKDEGGRHTPFFNRYRPQFYLRTTDVTGECLLPEGVEMVMPGDNVSLIVELIYPVAMEKGLRFAIREGGRTIGAGQVTEIVE